MRFDSRLLSTIVVAMLWGSQAGIAPAEAAQPSASSRSRMVSVDFNNVDLGVFVKFISELTGKNFVIDEKVKGKVTVFSPQPMSVEQAYKVFQSVLEGKGLTAYPVGDVIRIVPITEAPTDRGIRVYTLQHANAEEMAKLISTLTTRTLAAPGARADAQRIPGEFEGPVQVVPDKATNALIITASARDFEMLRGVVQRLDIRRRQVFVEMAILDVNVERLKELGNDLSGLVTHSSKDVGVLGGLNRQPEDVFSIAEAITRAGAAGSGISLGIVNIRAFLHALITRTDANVLSTPQLMTVDNQKARIVVGQNVPFLTGSTTSNVGAATVQTVERRDVGVTLELLPQILEGERIRLDIRQEISALTNTPPEILVRLGPTTDKRETTTSVIVNDRESVVIGGLIKDNLILNESKIPLLGDIPGLGWLFRFTSRSVQKSNLLVFLTPTIIKEEKEASTVREQKSGQMKEFLQDNRLEGKREELLKP
jgi:general secretion pathway protein D